MSREEIVSVERLLKIIAELEQTIETQSETIQIITNLYRMEHGEKAEDMNHWTS